jgi:hypothetical protein
MHVKHRYSHSETTDKPTPPTTTITLGIYALRMLKRCLACAGHRCGLATQRLRRRRAARDAAQPRGVRRGRRSHFRATLYIPLLRLRI